MGMGFPATKDEFMYEHSCRKEFILEQCQVERTELRYHDRSMNGHPVHNGARTSPADDLNNVRSVPI
jgi:hypothetical protein